MGEFEKYRLAPAARQESTFRRQKALPKQTGPTAVAVGNSTPDTGPKTKNYFKAMAAIKIPKSDMHALHKMDIELQDAAGIPGGGVAQQVLLHLSSAHSYASAMPVLVPVSVPACACAYARACVCVCVCVCVCRRPP